MSDPDLPDINDHPQIIALKKRAGEIKAIAPMLGHSQRIEVAAKEAGFRTYKEFRLAIRRSMRSATLEA